MTTMTIEQVRFVIASHIHDGDKPSLATMRQWLDAIDAAMAARGCSDE